MNINHRLLRLAFVSVFSFALGVLVRDVAQDSRDQERAEKLAAQVRACPQYVVVSKDGKFECRAMLPRFELYMPLKPLTRVRKAAQ
jgi:hypothetical protein